MAATMTGQWHYAVPLEEVNGNANIAPQRSEHVGGGENQRDSQIKDGKSLSRRTSAWDLMSDSEAAKQRRTSMRASNATAGRKRSRNQLRDKKVDETQERVDDSAWIHRDKLAQIEIQEMAEAGIYMRPPRRSESEGPAQRERRQSRSQSRPRRPSSRTSEERQNEITNDEDYAAAYPRNEESPRKHRISTVPSTVPSAPEEDPELEQFPAPVQEPVRGVPDFEQNRNVEPSRPSEEASAEPEIQRQQPQHNARPSTSRIPVSRVSPAPVSQNAVERDSNLPRSRAGSQNWNGNFDDLQYARKGRSGSVGSQAILDGDGDAMRTSPPGSSNKTSSNDENSPPKTRLPKKTTVNGRKPSTTSATTPRPGSSHQQSKRTPSVSATKRPGSSSGHKSRPSTGHFPPDGEAPWIATMYKPDPRLPPEEQMLPTHAKRMMQEQWEKEGKAGTVYDREFKLLNDTEFPKHNTPILSFDSQTLLPPSRSPSPQKDKASPNGSANGATWPLTPLSLAKSDNRSDAGSVRPGTSGGYKITPTIPDTPTIQRSPLPSPLPQNMPHNPTPRIPDLDEKEEAESKKGCCCVVM